VVQYPPHYRAPSDSTSENLPHYLEIKQGDALTVLKTLPDESMDMVLTSPPYYGLRDYGMAGQIGLEPTLEEYLENMLAITADASKGNEKSRWAGDGNLSRTEYGRCRTNDVPEKSLLLQAHRLAIRMIDEQGWILRNQLIWHKPNVMPSSADDRFTVDYEPIFFFTKSKEYFFEPQYEPHQEVSLKRAAYGWQRGKEYPHEANVP
jgi:site-specific DNA-methyltransferase (adenine-specific)